LADDQELDLLWTKLGAAVQDAELGTKYTALYSLSGNLDQVLAPGADEAQARALWGVSWEELKAKGLEIWGRVSPKLYDAFCNQESDIQKQLADLLKKGETGLDAALAALIIEAVATAFPVVAASAVAFFLAKLVLKLFVTEAYGLACTEWKKALA
jgi:hypothetical protein